MGFCLTVTEPTIGTQGSPDSGEKNDSSEVSFGDLDSSEILRTVKEVILDDDQLLDHITKGLKRKTVTKDNSRLHDSYKATTKKRASFIPRSFAAELNQTVPYHTHTRGLRNAGRPLSRADDQERALQELKSFSTYHQVAMFDESKKQVDQPYLTPVS